MTEDGRICRATDPEAAKWCLVSALVKCLATSHVYDGLHKVVSTSTGCRYVAEFNDGANWEAVRNTLDQAETGFKSQLIEASNKVRGGL